MTAKPKTTKAKIASSVSRGALMRAIADVLGDPKAKTSSDTKEIVAAIYRVGAYVVDAIEEEDLEGVDVLIEPSPEEKGGMIASLKKAVMRPTNNKPNRPSKVKKK